MGLTGCCGKESTRLLKQLREEEFILAYSWRGNSPYVGEELVAGGGAETDECWFPSSLSGLCLLLSDWLMLAVNLTQPRIT